MQVPFYGSQVPPARRLYQGAGVQPLQPPISGLGGIFQSLRRTPQDVQQDWQNSELPPEQQAEPGVNVPAQHEIGPSGRNEPIQVTPDVMTDTESAPKQVIDLNTQMNETFGQGSGPLGDNMQEFPGRAMSIDEYDELMQQIEEEMKTLIAGQSGSQDRIYAVSKGLGSYRPQRSGAPYA